MQTSTNGAQTSPSGVQTREGNAITDSTNEYKRSTHEHTRETHEYKWNTKTLEKRYLGRYRRLATEYEWVQTDTSGVQKPERVQTGYKPVQKE